MSFMLFKSINSTFVMFFFFQAEDGIRDIGVTGVQTCALPISKPEDTFLWEGTPVTSRTPLKAVMKEVSTIGRSGIQSVEVRFTAHKDASETPYHLAGEDLIQVKDWRGSSDTKLVFRGQVDRSKAKPQALTVLVGQTLKQTLCAGEPADCVPPLPDIGASASVEADRSEER